MADASDTRGGPEEVAFKLLYAVAWAENIDLEGWAKTDPQMDTRYLCRVLADRAESGAASDVTTCRSLTPAPAYIENCQ